MPSPDGWIYTDRVYAAAHVTEIKYNSSNDSIDWRYEREKEQDRKRGITKMNSLKDILASWLVIIATGLCVGLLAAHLDVVSIWLSDFREGVCVQDFWLDQNACCMGLDPGEICHSWNRWPDLFSLKMTLARAIVSYLLYIVLGVSFAAISALLVKEFAPQAYHSGLPEIKAILGGYIIEGYLSKRNILIKALGLATAVASGLSLGKEGPLVHVACCIGNQIANLFSIFRENEARKRQILSASAAAGLSVAFGAPVGGVLFSLEEASSYFSMETLWQSFVCAIVAAISLQSMDVSGTGRLVLFEVTARQVWRGFEIVPFLLMGVMGGLFGHYFTRLNLDIARLRRLSPLIQNNPVSEVALVALITAITSFLLPFMRIPTFKLVAALFSDCSANNDPLGLCDREHTMATIFFLLITCAFKFIETSIVFSGLRLPAGVFLPSTAIGATFGRAVGLFLNVVTSRYSTSSLFASCPADLPCISTSVYAVAGAASALAGVTRMTLSLVCIFFELTGSVEIVLQVMLSVMAAKFTGDFLARDGIYEAWISFRDLPFLNPKVEYKNSDSKAEDILSEDLVVIPAASYTLSEIEDLLETAEYKGFPIVDTMDSMILRGFITRNQLTAAVQQARSTLNVRGSNTCRFAQPFDGENTSNQRADFVEMENWIDQTPLTASKDLSLESIVHMFQRMGLRYLLLVHEGKVAGILTKHDIHYLLQSESSASSRADIQRFRQANSEAALVFPSKNVSEP